MEMGQEVCTPFSDQSPLPPQLGFGLGGPGPLPPPSHFESPSLTTQPQHRRTVNQPSFWDD